MATSTASSSSLTRYPRWVWVLTGLTAAYATYTIWTSLDPGQRPATSGLHRRGAIRQSRRRSHQHDTSQLSASMQASTQNPSDSSDVPPFGIFTAQVNSREATYHIGPRPPSMAQLERDFDLSAGTLTRIHTDMQHFLLDIIVERLVEPGAEELLTSNGSAYTSLLPLIAPLRDRNIGDLLGFIHLLAGRGRDDPEGEAEGDWRFEQANVALAFARRCGVDVAAARRGEPFEDSAEGGDADFAETLVESDLGHQTGESGAGIKSLLYTIAEEQAKRAAYVHRGTRCDSCGELPIRGIRWHCINCPDYDLCSNCESQYPSVHPPTHVFAKIRIPFSTLAQPHQVHELWYPGDPKRHWAPLKTSLRKRLGAETGFEDVTMEAYYEQFTCIANVTYAQDPAEIHAAIDRQAFGKAMRSDKWPAPLEPNLLTDRMFSFYDTDNNSLIGFEEFIHGIAYLRQPIHKLPGKRKNMDRLLRGYDLDGDGLLSRSDFLRMFSAKYAIQRHLIRDVVSAEEEEIAVHTIDVVGSSQPISAAFTEEDVPLGERRDPDMKRMDPFGDMQVALDPPLGDVLLPDEREIWDGPTVNTVSRRYGQFDDIVRDGSPFTLAHAEELRERYNRVESVPIMEGSAGAAGDINGALRHLVETDPRQTRGRMGLEPAESRWRSDLDDALAGGAAGHLERDPAPENMPLQDGVSSQKEEGHHEDTTPDSIPHENHTGDDRGGLESALPFPDFIFNRGRAHDVPRCEVNFGSDVLYQVIQEGFNELLDPLFLEREGLAENVRKTQSQRQRWRALIDEFKEAQKTFRDELRTHEKLSSSAPPAVNIVTEIHDPELSMMPDHVDSGSTEGRDPMSSSGTASPDWRAVRVTGQDTAASSTAVSPQPHDIAAEIRAQIQQQNAALPTDAEGLENFENEIREQPLDDLLAAAGYTIASPSESWPNLRDEWTNDQVPNETMSTSENDGDYTRDSIGADPTFPTNRPNDASSLHTSAERAATQDAVDASPSPPPTSHTPSSERQGGPASQESSPIEGGGSHSLHQENGHATQNHNDDKEPSQLRLDYFCRLDEEEQRILERGGPGRLTFAEIEEICRRDRSGALMGLVEGWLEWAAF